MEHRLSISGLAVSVGISAALTGSAWKRDTDLRGSVAAKTPCIHRAVETIRAEVEFAGPRPGKPVEFLSAAASMNYVLANCRPANYARLCKSGSEPWAYSVEQCLAQEAGICGTQVVVFQDLLKRVLPGLPSRSVQFYLHDEENNANRNHVAVEVYYKGAWRFFDVTAGTYWIADPGSPDALLSANQLRVRGRAGRGYRDLAVTNAADLWLQTHVQAGNDVFEYLEWPDTDVLYGCTGTLNLRPNKAKTEYALDNLPSAVGHVYDYCGSPGRIDYRLDPRDLATSDRRTLEITPGGVGLSPDADLVVSDKSCILVRIPLEEIQPDSPIRVPLPTDLSEINLRVESPSHKGCAVVKRIAIVE